MNSKHEVAVLHILNRMVVDRNFSWLMMGTESLNLCLQVEAERTGKTVEECEEWLYKQMRLEDERLKTLGKDVPEVQTLREKVEKMECQINNLPPVEPSRPKPSGVHSLPPLEYLEATALS